MNTPPLAGERGGAAETRLEFPDNRLLIDLCGPFDRNLAQLEQTLDVHILRRGNDIAVVGDQDARGQTADILRALYTRLEAGRGLDPGDIDGALRAVAAPSEDKQLDMFPGADAEIFTGKKPVLPRSPSQKSYVEALRAHELAFGIGPAGTGKTYLAVAIGVSMFTAGRVERLILSRPAVEAGERLGFLPGDMKEKIDPYMQPLYDALHDFLPGRQLARHIEERRIEIAPLAFMRGRTLANAFVVLDEAQNASAMQMKMFLTRLGEGSRMVVTGDRSQVDLPRGQQSGLIEAERILAGDPGISFTYFDSRDVVRHPLVARIIDAYERAES